MLCRQCVAVATRFCHSSKQMQGQESSHAKTSQLTVKLVLCNCTSSHSSLGMLPVRSGFPYNKKVLRVEPSTPSSVGIVPVSLLLKKYTCWRFVSRPSSVGIGPVHESR
jgi:hypothetical protein